MDTWYFEGAPVKYANATTPKRTPLLPTPTSLRGITPWERPPSIGATTPDKHASTPKRPRVDKVIKTEPSSDCSAAELQKLIVKFQTINSQLQQSHWEEKRKAKQRETTLQDRVVELKVQLDKAKLELHILAAEKSEFKLKTEHKNKRDANSSQNSEALSKAWAKLASIGQENAKLKNDLLQMKTQFETAKQQQKTTAKLVSDQRKLMQEQRELMIKDHEKSAKKITQLQELNTELKKEVQLLKQENVSQEDLNKTQAALAEMHNRAEMLGCDGIKKDGQVARLLEECNQLLSMLNSSKKEQATASDEADKLRTRVGCLATSLAKTSEALEGKEKELKNTQQQLADKSEKHAALLKHMDQEMKIQILESECEQLNEKLEQSENQFFNALQNKDQLLADTLRELAEAQQQLADSLMIF